MGAAKIYKLELCNEEGQIATNKDWDPSQTKDLEIKMGAKVTEEDPDRPGASIQVHKPYTVYLSILNNCKRLSLTVDGALQGYNKDLLTVDNDNKSITFLNPGKCMVTIIGEHRDGSTFTVTWKFNVLGVNWTEDTDRAVGDAPKYVDRDTMFEVAPSGALRKVGDVVEYDVITNANTAGVYEFSVENEHKDKVNIDKDYNRVKALKAGTFKVLSTAQFRQAKAYKYEVDYTVVGEDVVEVESNAVVIQLFNMSTGRVTKLATSNNNSEEDVTYVLPEASGTLVTDNDLKQNLSIIERPIIISPTTGVTDHIGGIKSSPFSVIMNSKEEHARTTWELGNNSTFDQILMTKVETYKANLTVFNPGLMGGVKAWVRCKYHSERYDSLWSEPVEVTFGGHGWDSLKQPTKMVNPDNPMDGTYYGIVPHSELVDDYDYRGTYNTIKNAVIMSEDGLTVKKYKDYGQNMKPGYQVLHPKEGETKLSLWYCKKPMDPALFRKNAPEAGSEYWELDERDNLCTPYHFVDRVGVGIIDPFKREPVNTWNMNADGYSTGPNFLKKLVNHLDGWMKFGYNGKILYTTQKPISLQIAWTDLAKRDVVYGNRTLRIGRRLYWVRLLTKEEYIMLMTNLTNGKLGNLKEEDLMLSTKTWIEDFQESPIRIRMTGKNQEVISDPKYREGVWRPVLELIPEGSEPYNNLPDCPMADDEVFQYDPYSDTGFFGYVPYNKLVSGEQLITMAAHSGGSTQYLQEGYLKFYWHGRILYACKKSIKHSVSYQQQLNCHSLHGVDMGGLGKKVAQIEHNGKTLEYPISCMLNSRIEPHCNLNYESNIPGVPYNAGQLLKDPMDREAGKYSMWQELFYRVGIGYFGFMEVAGDNISWIIIGKYYQMEHHGGYQKGDNWTEYAANELCVLANQSYGTYCFGTENGNNAFATFNPNSSKITWPDMSKQPTPGNPETTDEVLEGWCKEYNLDATWFKQKYSSWKNYNFPKSFVKEVADVYHAATDLEENYTPPSGSVATACGALGLARWTGGNDFSYTDQHYGLRYILNCNIDRLRVRR